MPEPSRRTALLRRALAWGAAWVFAGALYLLLIDTTSLPELLVGAGAAVLAATGFRLAGGDGAANGHRTRPEWLGALLRPLVKAPADIALVSAIAVRQLLAPSSVVGEFRAERFREPEEAALEGGRRAVAESFGSFAPNTIVIGVDAERELILAHQLRRRGGPEAIDLLGLG